jgi:hypothetical protein
MYCNLSHFKLEPSIGLFENQDGQHTCPLCQASFDRSVPVVSEIQTSLDDDLSKLLNGVTRSSPRLQKVVDDLEKQVTDIKQRLLVNIESLKAIQLSKRRLSELRDQNARRALVVGRISLYLESLPEVEDTSGLQQDIISLRPLLTGSSRPQVRAKGFINDFLTRCGDC